MKDAVAMLQKVRLENEAYRRSEVKARSVADLVLQNKEKARAELSTVRDQLQEARDWNKELQVQLAEQEGHFEKASRVIKSAEDQLMGKIIEI